VLQRLTVAATNPDDVTTRVRATEAGFFREGTLLQLRRTFGPLTGRPASMTNLTPRSNPEVITRLRTLRAPGPAALLAIALATAMTPSQLARLRMNEFTETTAGELELTTCGERHKLPGPFAAAVRAALTERRHTPDRRAADTLFPERGSRATVTTRALSRAATQAGVTPPRPIGNVVIHNLRFTERSP
jgi:integrase